MGMSISANSIIFGVNAKSARALMLEVLRNDFTIEGKSAISHSTIERLYQSSIFQPEKYKGKQLSRMAFERQFNGDREESNEAAAPIIAKMIEEGYITPLKKESKGTTAEYEITEKAGDLCRAKFIKRLSRESAIKRLNEFLSRVDEWNSAQPQFIITNVWLYGSMLTNSKDVGDIDLVYDWYKNKNPAPELALTNDQINSMYATGKRPIKEALTYIKARSPYISLDGFTVSELDDIRGGYVQILKDGKILTKNLPRLDCDSSITP